MFWAQMKVLLPSFFGYWVFMVALASATWYGWTKIYTNHAFKWHAPVLFASAASFYMMASTLIGFYQNNAIANYQQKMQVAQQQAQQQQAGDQAAKAKGDFLKIVEQLIAAPDQITPDNKQKLFTQFNGLFPNGNNDRQIYEKEILAVYSCQQYFWEDALASYKAKKILKSDSRKECETLPGTFYNREKLVPVETAKGNDDTIVKLASHKRLPASDGKDVEVNEKMLRNALDTQIKAVDAIKKIFN